jgi:peptidoglycan hydrolase-like protein with peptidoglycan-binding domain
MTKIRLCVLGAALLTNAALVLSPVPARSAPQTSSGKSKSSASKRRRRTKARPRAQTSPTPDRIREIQSALQREGALDKEPTGKWDAATVEAMKKYQSGHDLNPTGKIDALTLEKLGLGADTAGKGAPSPPVSTAAPNSDPPR